MTDQVPILDFMLVRPPSEVEAPVMSRRYIRDVVLDRQARAHLDVDLQSAQSPSPIGRLIYQKVFCETLPANDLEAVQDIRGAVLGLMDAYEAQCDWLPDRKKGPRHPVAISGAAAAANILPLDIAELERHAYLQLDGLYYILPDRLGRIDAPMAEALTSVLSILHDFAALAAADFGADKLAAKIRPVFDGQPLASVVFDETGYAPGYAETRRRLFDALYLLYIMRRWASVNFEPIMDGLRAMHVLEALAVDELYAMGRAGHLTPSGKEIIASLSGDIPALRDWAGPGAVLGLPLIATVADLAEYLLARPIVHPIFAQLQRYARPFNKIKPLGVGDLKVVKQWLVAYEAGEISDIHNVMQGETKDRTHRRLERTEETFSSSTTSSSESSHDTSSTDRFEVKREAENVVKQDLNVNANVRAQYDNKVVLVAVGAGFAYNRSSTDQSKIAQNFSREVVDKAVTRVQSSTVQQRTTTKLFETEETNKHGFVNTNPGNGHISGIFQWVDKLYQAQVFNYGKRMMFEFVLPEPAAFLVESRLRSFEATMDVPREPKVPVYQAVAMDFQPGQVDANKFEQLRAQYDLSGIAMPPEKKTVALTNQETNQAFFKEWGMDSNQRWYAKTYACHVSGDGYDITKVLRAGDVYYAGSHDPNNVAWKDRNFFNLSINGTPLIKADYSNTAYIAFYRSNDDAAPVDGPLALTSDDLTLTLGFQSVKEYALELSLELTVSAARWQAFQLEVYNAVKQIKQRVADAANVELKQGYDGAMSTFRNRLDDLKATAIHELIQGQSEDYNRDLIMTELRRQCLAMFTKEFDTVTTDDLLTDYETMGTRSVDLEYRRFTVDDTVSPLKAEFDSTPHTIDFPVMHIEAAKVKGRYIQFLEQAFEWGRMGYICYPYFWATPPKWIALMNRTDDGDPNLTAFLRAGAIKVLVAVTPAYDEAVLHFLATREPWEGGPAPVIGDPLYLPLFEELHRQQDDRYGAQPDGDPWTFTLPTSLVYLHGSTTALPEVPAIKP